MSYFTQGNVRSVAKPETFNNVENGMYLEGSTGISGTPCQKLCCNFQIILNFIGPI